ncbi:hypothetical protein KJA14_02160 [Patescibacteria group bacterium]|nr:hypothetical protein [Patescibacteria group bacterium]
MNQEEKIQTEYEEIDLMDYVKVILKRKWLILAVFLAAVIVAGVFSWFSPKFYKIDTSLEIGRIIGQVTEAPFEVVEPPEQLVEKINNGIYGWFPGIKISNPTDTNLIKIEAISKEPQKTKKILENINELILAEHNNKINSQKNLLEKEIEELQEKIDFFISKGQETAILQLEINNLQRKKEALQPTQVIREPTISENPVRPKPLLNIIIAAVLGVFIGIFWAFSRSGGRKAKYKT